MRRTILSAAAPACLLIGLTPVAASADPAPVGQATATAAQVTNLVSVSSTGAKADQSAAEARAAVISVQGKPVLGTGGAQQTEGDSGGALLDTGDKLPARLEVAPWHATAKGNAGSAHRSSHGSAALARLTVPSVAKVGVLTSDAQADHATDKSTGTSVSDGVDLTLLDTLHVVLLHSEVTSVGKGHSYIVNLGGTEIGTDDQLGKSPLCSLDATVASLTCLTASGGAANGITSGAAEVAGVKTALGLDPTALFTTAASSGIGSAPAVVAPAVAALPAAEAPRAAAVQPAPAAALPRTGAALASMAASAFAALLGGLTLRLFGRRRRVAA
jgi:hypothetical protein